MESSDENFAWTDASSDSSRNSVISSKKNKPTPSPDREEAHNDTLYNDSETDQDDKKHKRNKNKKNVSGTIENGINKSVKYEPMSDIEKPRKKKRPKCDETDNVAISNASLNDAENYLNVRVKEEQATFVEHLPTKKKKTKKVKKEPEETEENETVHYEPIEYKKDIEEHDLDASHLVNGNHSENSEITDSKKKKKRKDKFSIDNDISEILMDPEENHKTKKKKRKRIKEEIQNHNSDDSEFQQNADNTQVISSTLINNTIYENGQKHNSDMHSDSIVKSATKRKRKESSKEVSRVKDRLRFEEEESIHYNSREDVPDNDIASQLEEFISTNINLKPLHADLYSDPEISDDDEVWIVKGPQDISAENLENINLTLDGKKKVKINGNNYDTIVDSNINTTPILLFNKKKIFIKNKPLRGVISLRKRIPKINIPYETLMVSEDSGFIPLPETKCRHPLFGIDYKNAAKVPSQIAERLKSPTVLHNANSKQKKRKRKGTVETESDIDVKPSIETLHSERKKNKYNHDPDDEIDVKPDVEVLHSKKKKKKGKKHRLEIESDCDVKPDIEILHSKKKKNKTKQRIKTESDVEMNPIAEEINHSKKKRKHSDDHVSKRKRVKREPNSADAWECEQAIERNLFEF